jgi:hypothetical protein
MTPLVIIYASTYGRIFFYCFFSGIDASHPEIWFQYTVMIPATPQETVEEAGIEPGTAALQSGSPLSHHIPTEPPRPHWATTTPTQKSNIFLYIFEKIKVTETKICEIPWTSLDLYWIPRHGIPYNSAEFLLILYRIRNVRKWNTEFRIEGVT